MTTNAILDMALKMAQSGLTPVPMNGKAANVSGYPKFRNITPEQVNAWHDGGKLQNLAVLTGEASQNLVVIDFDTLPGYEQFCQKFPELAETRTVATSRGRHVWLYVELLPDNVSVKTDEFEGEIRAQNLLACVPPSIHASGAVYTFCKDVPTLKVTDIAKVVEWVRAFDPKKWTERKPVAYGEVRDSIRDTLRAHFEAGPHKKHGDWINCQCPNHLAHKHGDDNWSFGYHIDGSGNCFACGGGMSPQKLCEHVGIDYKSRGGVFDVKPVMAAPEAPRLPVVEKGNGKKVLTIGRTEIIKRSDMLSDVLMDVVDLDKVDDAPPVIFPLRSLHHLGGEAHVLLPGQVIGIVGASGTGKTSALETMADAWLRQQIPVLMWTPEWRPKQMVERAIQRYGGPSMNDLYLHKIYKHELKAGKRDDTGEVFLGKQLSMQQEEAATKAVKMLRGWEREISYMSNPLLATDELSGVIREAALRITPRPQVLIIDYAQLLRANERDLGDDTSMYNLILRIKAACLENNLVGVLATQTTKQDARDAFNKGEFLGTTVLNVTKNSRGVKGRVRIGADPARLRLEDTRHVNQSFGDDSNYLSSQAGRYINDDAFNLYITLNPDFGEAIA